jgi:phospholipid-binding lipoprotein MlaA
MLVKLPRLGGMLAAAAVGLAALQLPGPAFAESEPASAAPNPAVSAPHPAASAAEQGAFLDEEMEFGIELPPDPFEPANRKLFAFNQALDRFVFDPMVRGYRFVVPDPVRRSVRRAFVNLNAPAIVANDILQGRFVDAAETLGCFALNSTVGWAGLFDAAHEMGWEMQPADFGQTLALAGVGSGPYIVLPVLGPSTVRDGFGDVVDQLFHPLSYVVGFGPTWYFNSLVGGGTGLALLDGNVDQLHALRDSSVDFYAALRSAYLQNRTAQLRAEQRAPAKD